MLTNDLMIPPSRSNSIPNLRRTKSPGHKNTVSTESRIDVRGSIIQLSSALPANDVYNSSGRSVMCLCRLLRFSQVPHAHAAVGLQCQCRCRPARVRNKCRERIVPAHDGLSVGSVCKCNLDMRAKSLSDAHIGFSASTRADVRDGEEPSRGTVQINAKATAAARKPVPSRTC